MKSNSLFVVAIALLTPSLAFGGTKNAANFELDQSVTVSGTQLAPGQYKLTWEGNGPDVTVSFAEGKKTIATAHAKLVSSRNNEDAIDTSTAADNKTVLNAIDLKNITLQFENDVPSAGN
jgi:hypothetical protein